MMWRKPERVLLLCVGLLAACTAEMPESVSSYRDAPAADDAAAPGSGQVAIQFLGTAGFRIRYQDDEILTAPFFSNSSYARLLSFTELAVDHKAVDRWIPDVSRAQALLIGHAHYDHLLDVPYILRAHARKAVAYGSLTAINILAAELPQARYKAVNALAAHGRRAGVWHYDEDRTMRWMALRSRHAPHLPGLTLLEGRVEAPLIRLPRTFTGYVEGQTLAWLIDFLDTIGRVRFRIYYQDSAAGPPDGVLPDLDEPEPRRVDVAILGVASFQNLDAHPQRMIEHLQARHYVFSHWEDFFVPFGEGPYPAPGVDLEQFIVRAEAALPPDSDWRLPAPLATMYFD